MAPKRIKRPISHEDDYDWKKTLFIWRSVSEEPLLTTKSLSSNYLEVSLSLMSGSWISGTEKSILTDDIFKQHVDNKFNIKSIPKSLEGVDTIKQLETNSLDCIKAVNTTTPFDVISSYDLDNGEGYKTYSDDSHTLYIDGHKRTEQGGYICRLCGYGQNQFGNFCCYGFIELTKSEYKDDVHSSSSGSNSSEDNVDEQEAWVVTSKYRKEVILSRRYLDDKDPRATIEGAEKVLNEYKEKFKSNDGKELKEEWRQTLPYKYK
jgi:hypothetical protein